MSSIVEPPGENPPFVVGKTASLNSSHFPRALSLISRSLEKSSASLLFCERAFRKKNYPLYGHLVSWGDDDFK